MAAKTKPGFERIDPAELQVGMYVALGEHWLRHPFLFNDFLIQNEKQLRTIRELGLHSIQWSPERSRLEPAVEAHAHELSSTEAEVEEGESEAERAEREAQERAKQERIRLVAERRQARAKAEKRYESAAAKARQATTNLFAAPAESLAVLADICNDMLVQCESGSSLYLLSAANSGEGAHPHAMAVMLLSTMVARALGLPEPVCANIGMGGFLHDVGRVKVGDSIWTRANRSKHEEAIYRQHPQWGEEILRDKMSLTQEMRDVLLYHHERFGGQGFPKGLSGNAIPLAARIVGLVDRYENLCNPQSTAPALQPYQALVKIYKSEAGHWDPACLKALISVLGVYPPGTLVELSNGQWGMVCSFEIGNTTRPTVEVYDPDVPKSEALIVNLREEDEVSIQRAVTPDALPREAFDYLAPRRRMVYFQAAKTL